MEKQNESDREDVEYLVENRVYNLLFERRRMRGIFVDSAIGVRSRIVHGFVFREDDVIIQSAYIDDANLILEGENVRSANDGCWTFILAYKNAGLPPGFGIEAYSELDGILQEAGL